MGDPTEEKAFRGPYTREDGFLGYNEMCEMRAAAPIQWTTRWDDEAKVPYVFHENMWVSLDDAQSITNKVRYYKLRSLKLGGLRGSRDGGLGELAYDEWGGGEGSWHMPS